MSFTTTSPLFDFDDHNIEVEDLTGEGESRRWLVRHNGEIAGEVVCYINAGPIWVMRQAADLIHKKQLWGIVEQSKAAERLKPAAEEE